LHLPRKNGKRFLIFFFGGAFPYKITTNVKKKKKKKPSKANRFSSDMEVQKFKKQFLASM
jgi:hypothetical protein